MKRLYQDNILREIISSAMDAFIVVDSQNKVVEWNKEAEKLFGWTIEEAVGTSLSSLIIPEEFRQLHEEGIRNFNPETVKRTGRRVELVAMSKNKERIPIEVTIAPVEIRNKIFFGASVRDLRATKREQEELRRKANLLNLSRDGIYVVDKNHKLVLWNLGAQKMYGYTQEEALGHISYKLLKSNYDTPDGRTFLDIVRVLMTTGEWEGEVRHTTKNGKELIVLSRWAIDRVNEEILVTNTDITDLRENTKRAEYLATHDDLTGLPNRRLFDDRIEHGIMQGRRHKTKFAVMLLDLDRFKVINDSLGHNQGDILLKEIGNRLRKTIREEDTVARLGGDEFVILIENIQTTCVKDIVEKVINAVSKPISLESLNISRIDASIGISIFPDDGTDAHTLIRNADLAMYKAKEVDKGSFRFYSVDMNEVVQRRLQNEHQLRRALENEEFELYFQPKICTVENGVAYRTTGVEALIRWNHPDRGVVSPVEFISLAEEIGLIIPIGEWVLRQACCKNMEWQRQGKPPIQMSVNLSIHQLSHSGNDIVKTIAKALKDSGLDPKWLDLEITESAAMNNVEATIETLERIRDLGVSLSIDDFGTGYSSLSYLKKMPINTLKIDQSFVRGIPNDVDDICIVRSIIAMAHSMKLKVIAEGVSDSEQVAFLDTMQCDEMQGYIFSKPCAEPMFSTKMITKSWNYHNLTKFKTG